MKALLLEIKGNWAQFRRAETNNNPLSHDLITKTALVGMMGAVLGIERKEMRSLFPQLSEDIRYGVQVLTYVNKQSWGFTLRRPGDAWTKSPGQMEFIRNPEYLVIVGLYNNRSKSLFDQFVEYCKNGQACYEPVLGLHNCPAEIFYKEDGELEDMGNGLFETKGFVTNNHIMSELDTLNFRVGFDKIPTYQNDDFWNLPDRFQSIIYPSENNILRMEGHYYQFKNQLAWCLL